MFYEMLSHIFLSLSISNNSGAQVQVPSLILQMRKQAQARQ